MDPELQLCAMTMLLELSCWVCQPTVMKTAHLTDQSGISGRNCGPHHIGKTVSQVQRSERILDIYEFTMGALLYCSKSSQKWSIFISYYKVHSLIFHSRIKLQQCNITECVYLCYIYTSINCQIFHQNIALLSLT